MAGKSGKSKKIKKSNFNIDELFQGRNYLYLGGMLIIILCTIAYINIFGNEANFDDHVWMNFSQLRDLGNFSEIFGINRFRVVSFYTFAINYAISGFDLYSYHLFNILIHIINGMLVWRLVLLLFETPALENSSQKEYAKYIALLTALIFIVHPMQTQAVAYIYQRLTSIVTLFYLSTVLLYIMGRIEQGGFTKKIRYFGPAFLTLVMAMFSKENGFTLPIMIIMIEIFLFSRKIKFRYILLFLLPLAGGAFIFIKFRMYRLIIKEYTAYTGETIDNFTYFYTQLKVIPEYLKMIFFPAGQNIDHNVEVATSFFEFPVMGGAAILLAIIIFAIILFRKNRLASFGIFWFFLTISIESSFIPILDVMVEHRVYLPIFGIILVFNLFLFGLLKKKKTAAIGINAAIILIFLACTISRNTVWENPMALWSDAIEKSPNKARPYNGRGMAYYNAGDYDKALEDFNWALDLYPDFDFALQNRGNTYMKMENFREAADDYARILHMNKWSYANYNNLANAYYKLQMWDSAVANYTRFIKEYPDLINNYINRGNAYKGAGMADSAIADYQRALKISPRVPSIYSSIGEVYFLAKQYDAAIENYSRALNLEPGNIKHLFNRATCYYYMEDFEKAIKDYSVIVNAKPDYLGVSKFCGMSYEKIGKPRKALDCYLKHLGIYPNDVETLYYAARILATIGKRPQAVQLLQRALEVNPQYKDAAILLRRIR